MSCQSEALILAARIDAIALFFITGIGRLLDHTRGEGVAHAKID